MVIVTANVFPILQTVENLVRELSIEHRFRRRFGSQHVKASQMLGKFPWENFIMFFYRSQWSWFGKCLP